MQNQLPPQEVVEWVPCGKFGSKRCREGGNCRNAQCGFAHPHDWIHFHGQYLAMETMQAWQQDGMYVACEPGHGLSAEEMGWMVDAMSSSEAELAWMAEAMDNQHVLAGDDGQMSADEAAWLEAQMTGMQLAEHKASAPGLGAPSAMPRCGVALSVVAAGPAAVSLCLSRRST